jgi:hypothetical protein
MPALPNANWIVTAAIDPPDAEEGQGGVTTFPLSCSATVLFKFLQRTGPAIAQAPPPALPTHPAS